MQPCFMLRIPGQYRARGHDYVALSMFADQQHDEPREVRAVAEYLAASTPIARQILIGCCSGTTSRTAIRWNFG